VRTEAAGDTVHLHDNAFSEDLVPDVRGMTLRDALYLMENRGLQVRIIGKGRVTKQSLYPGRRIQKGDMVYLTLG
jgi:cell division protein FtsI (penicillin-binding protein 3)